MQINLFMKILIFLFVWLKIWGIVFSHHGQGSWLNWYNMTCLPSTWKRGVVIRSDSSHSYFRQIILVLSLRLLKLCVLFYYDIKGLEFVSNNRSMNVPRHFYITGMRNFLRSLKYPGLVILLVNIYAVY
jgi:hypothetical protein